MRAGLAVLFAEIGMHAEAQAEAVAIARTIDQIPQDAGYVPTLAHLADVYATLGDRAGAHLVYERLQAEIEFVGRELAAAIGFGGRERPGGSPAERARSTVTKGIKSAIEAIGAADPKAGRYLARTVRTGTCCVYRPDPDDGVRWQF